MHRSKPPARARRQYLLNPNDTLMAQKIDNSGGFHSRSGNKGTSDMPDTSSQLLEMSISEKVAKLSAFIASDIDTRSARGLYAAGGCYLLIARSPVSPVAIALRDHAAASPGPASASAPSSAKSSSAKARRPSRRRPSRCRANAVSPATLACCPHTSSLCLLPTAPGSATACAASRRSATPTRALRRGARRRRRMRPARSRRSGARPRRYARFPCCLRRSPPVCRRCPPALSTTQVAAPPVAPERAAQNRDASFRSHLPQFVAFI